MINSKIIMVIIIAILCLCGCVIRSHEIFDHNLRSAIGSNIQSWGTTIGRGGFGPPGLISKQDTGKHAEYIYQTGALCKWYLLVNRQSGVVFDAGYFSNPNECIGQDGPRL